jgi:hypothetical protein
VVSTQDGGEPHIVLPPLHVQLSLEHVLPAAVHALPQSPQLEGVLMLVHTGGLPHSLDPVPVHMVVHCPLLHDPVQVVVQLPQC